MLSKTLKLHVAASFLLVSSAIAAKCNNDPCLAVVKKGKSPGGYGGCGAFFAQTIIPAAVTKTSTATVITTRTIIVSTGTLVSTTTTATETETVISGSQGKVKKRAVTARPTTTSQTTVPKYAKSQCPDTSRYSSACSCVGAKHKTVTLATPTTTVIREKTVTASTSTATSITGTATTTITTTITTTSTCRPDPTTLVQNPGFESVDSDNEPSPWVLSKFSLLSSDSDDSYSGEDFVYTYSTRGLSGSYISQELSNAFTEGSVKYTFSAAVGWAFHDYTGITFSVILDGNTIVSNELLCTDADPCNEQRANNSFRVFSHEGTLPSLSANPTLKITVDYPSNTGTAFSVDDVQLSVYQGCS